jgi:hypothetical protein
MGIFDKAIERLATQIVKVAPTVTPITQDQIRSVSQGYGNSVGLPRDPNMANVPFTPGIPLVPGAINPLRPDGRPNPRRYEFTVAQNINVTEQKLVPFKTLRAAADQIDILRRCIEVLKAKMVGLDWDIVLADSAVEKVMKDTGEKSYTRAMAIAKDELNDEINKAKQFWKVPDVSNGLMFSDWLNMMLEDVLVLDAVAVWPQMSVSGDLKGLQLLDGSTIKPLIDDRGMRPEAPQPAFQQILYGFPRSEFSAPVEETEADGEFTSSEMAYLVKNRRTTSIYGFSPVERSLSLADIYLRRQQWIRAEYTDGVMPEIMFQTDATFGNNPDLLRQYENVFNDDLAGQTEQRKRARLLPAGLIPHEMPGYDQRFSDTLDEFLIVSICGHFGVAPSEIGFNSKGGLGGSGLQDGEANSSEVIGLVPLSQWVGKMLSQLSYIFAGMPRELEFKFMQSVRSDKEAEAREQDIRLKNGSMTLNEARSKSGLPLLDNAEADTPLIFTPTGVLMATVDGLTPIDVAGFLSGSFAGGLEGSEEPPVEEDEPEVDTLLEDEPVEADQPEVDETIKAAKDEIKQFLRWLRKSPNRAFEFKVVPDTFATTLNKFVAVEDLDGARWYAERYLA